MAQLCVPGSSPSHSHLLTTPLHRQEQGPREHSELPWNPRPLLPRCGTDTAVHSREGSRTGCTGRGRPIGHLAFLPWLGPHPTCSSSPSIRRRLVCFLDARARVGCSWACSKSMGPSLLCNGGLPGSSLSLGSVPFPALLDPAGALAWPATGSRAGLCTSSVHSLGQSHWSDVNHGLGVCSGVPTFLLALLGSCEH